MAALNPVYEEMAGLRLGWAKSQPHVMPIEAMDTSSVSDREAWGMRYHEAVLSFERQALVDKVRAALPTSI